MGQLVMSRSRTSAKGTWLAGLVIAVGLMMSPALGVAGDADTGSIDGRVLDESKAAAPGATVRARSHGTGLTRTAVSSAIGTYHIAALPAGSYDVTVELTGFASQVSKGVPVQVGTVTTVDFAMKVAGVAETVTVGGETSLIQTTTSEVGQVITSTLIDNIPLNGRKFQDLSLLVPGTRPANYYDPTKTEVGGVSYGGGTGRNVIINVDGGDDNDGVVRGLLQQYSAEAIQEYKVTTQRYSAEFGRSTGGIVNVVTKSGTNEFHGGAFVFARDQRLNSLSFFQQKLKDEGGCDAPGRLPCKPPFEQQQFGGSLGGPIRKDKAHFFVAYERNRRDDYATVFTNGVLPDQEGNFPQPFRNSLLDAKLDFQLGERNTLVARYALEDQRREHDFIGGNTLASAGALNTNKIHSGIVKNTTVFGSSKVNEVLVEFQHYENHITADDPMTPGIATPDFFFGADPLAPQQTIQKRWQLRDDFSFRKQGWGGDHDFKVGAEIIMSHYGGFYVPTLYGFFAFSQSPAGCPEPCQDPNAYLNAIPDFFSGSAGSNTFDDDWTYVAAYVQDAWKPTRKLTLNLGLRYEIQYGPYTNRFDTMPLRAIAAAGYDTGRKQDYGGIGARLGFAYDVKGDAKVVVRGGYGRYYDEIFQNITIFEYWSQVSSPTNFVSVSPAPFTPNEYAANRDAIRASYLDPTFQGQVTHLTAPTLRQPSADQYNLGFSVQPARRLAFDLDYVHTSGHDEIASWYINTATNVRTDLSPPGAFAESLPSPTNGIGPIRVEGNRGHSAFDGVYVTGKYRGPAATVLATYAWTKARNQAGEFTAPPSDVTNANFDLDYASTPNDVRHRFTLGAVWPLPWGFQYSTSLQGNTGKPFTAFAGEGGIYGAVRAVNPATGRTFDRTSFLAGPEVAGCGWVADGCTVAVEHKGVGLAFLSWDMRLSKVFKVAGKGSIELLFEVFNVTNHVNFDRDSYVVVFSSPNFGHATDIVKDSQRQAEGGVRFRF
jgi:hypothetical protein